MSAIADARKRAGLKIAEIAQAVKCNGTWLGLAEAGVRPLASEDEKTILVAIARLQKFAQTVRAARDKLTADLKLSARSGASRPQLPTE
jgi:hypothetical protein